MGGKRAIALAGDVHGGMTLKSFSHVDKNGNACWNFICHCGKEATNRLHAMKKGTVKSCGCLSWRYNIVTEASIINGVINKVYKRYVKRHELISEELCISREKFYELSQKECYYCGKFKSNRHNPTFNNKGIMYPSVDTNTSTHIDFPSVYYEYNGLDRVENEKGYTENNVVTCCRWCNQMKLDRSQNEFFEHISNIYNKRKFTK